jgi:hypothetical protein
MLAQWNVQIINYPCYRNERAQEGITSVVVLTKHFIDVAFNGCLMSHNKSGL